MAQQQNNYFTSMIKRYNGNTEFMSFLKPEQIQRSAKERIFREMVRGQIDYGVYGNFFLDPKFLDNIIIACTNELDNSQSITKALMFYDMNFPGDVSIIHCKTIYQGLCNVYYTILTRLNQVKFTNNVGFLTDIPTILKNFQKIM